MSLQNATKQFVNMTSLLGEQIEDLALQVGNIPIYSQPLLTGIVMPDIYKRNSNQAGQGVLSNQIIIEKKSYQHGGLEKVIETYIDDEYLLQCLFLCALSVFSFFPAIYFLNK